MLMSCGPSRTVPIHNNVPTLGFPPRASPRQIERPAVALKTTTAPRNKGRAERPWLNAFTLRTLTTLRYCRRPAAHQPGNRRDGEQNDGDEEHDLGRFHGHARDTTETKHGGE